MRYLAIISLAIVSILSACSTSSRSSAAADANAPQMISDGKRDEWGRVKFRWDRPGEFAKISEDQKRTGDIVCMMIDVGLEATGYHPHAKNLIGREFPRGGYSCEAKKNSDKPDEVSPRLVRTNGVLGWDRPAAFGRIPDQLKLRGNDFCKVINRNYEAIAYHPKPIMETGNVAPSGGFLCAPMLNS